MARFGLAGSELHTAWLLRPYVEQESISGFGKLNHAQRRAAVQRARNQHLLQLQNKKGGHKAYKQARKNYDRSEQYIHLTRAERTALSQDVANCIASWRYARLFFECIDKLHFDPARVGRTIEEQAFEQIISRFERYLRNITGANAAQRNYGLVVHDNNETVARKHTAMMRSFHKQGTLWTNIDHIIETPMFVDSSLTSLVQAADLCAYAIRRYVENQETALFDKVFERADRLGQATVGARHFTRQPCPCQICANHA